MAVDAFIAGRGGDVVADIVSRRNHLWARPWPELQESEAMAVGLFDFNPDGYAPEVQGTMHFPVLKIRISLIVFEL